MSEPSENSNVVQPTVPTVHGPLYQWGRMFASLMDPYRSYNVRLRTWLGRMRWYRCRSSNGRFWSPVAPWRSRMVSLLICKRWLAEVENEVQMNKSRFSSSQPSGLSMTQSFSYDFSWFLFTRNLAVCLVSPGGSGMLAYLRLSQACVGMTLLLASTWTSRIDTVISSSCLVDHRRKYMERTWFVMCKRVRRITVGCDGLSRCLSMTREGSLSAFGEDICT